MAIAASSIVSLSLSRPLNPLLVQGRTTCGDFESFNTAWRLVRIYVLRVCVTLVWAQPSALDMYAHFALTSTRSAC